MKTREKIILASLELFNEKGERSVTTNHIAAHLGISPGNLYYHFRNKEDIIQSIFQEYINYMRESFVPAEENVPAEVFLKQYCEDVFGSIWRFRFFHSSMPDLVLRDKELHKQYLAAHDVLGERARQSVSNLKRDSIIEIETSEISDLVELMRVVGSFWMSYSMANTLEHNITKAGVYSGVLKVIALLNPYATDKGIRILNELKGMYGPLAHDDLTD